jgi:hypothetical protein
MKRSKKGQSLVEYALGIGCISACCMIALGTIGHISGDILESVMHAYNYTGTKAQHNAAIVNRTAKPWDITTAGQGN